MIADVDDHAAAGGRHPESSGAPVDPRTRFARPVRKAALALAAVLVVTAAGAGWWLRRGGDGDLPVLEPNTGYVLESMSPGKTSFSLGSLYIREAGKDVEILEVKALTSPNIEYLGAVAVWPRDLTDSLSGVGPGYPMPEQRRHHHPAFGVVVPAAETAYIPKAFGEPVPLGVMAGFRVRSGEYGAVNGVTVVYRVNGKTKREHFRQAVIACVKPHPCQSPEGDGGPNFADAVLQQFGLAPKG